MTPPPVSTQHCDGTTFPVRVPGRVAEPGRPPVAPAADLGQYQRLAVARYVMSRSVLIASITAAVAAWTP
ncbi:hypothetical protein GCM10022220_08450 [Actinocatenispora rupis]|uniref:Uncharacterized protein n=1 Tax=Actinocatenispora rupis TaxID=519421 RepID=A0A8J3J1A6_9ACTN|nr:hypothetical protein Aru02nite_10460 [Actinocatenispora rupis]